jgi:hypothetical protein
MKVRRERRGGVWRLSNLALVTERVLVKALVVVVVCKRVLRPVFVVWVGGGGFHGLDGPGVGPPASRQGRLAR